MLGVVITPYKTLVLIFTTILNTKEEEGYNWLIYILALFYNWSEIQEHIDKPGVFITNGNKALINAIDEFFPEATQQRYI